MNVEKTELVNLRDKWLKLYTNTAYNKTNSDKLRKMIIVQGASYSSPILTNGKEDYAKSRRVELKIITKDMKN
jgi:hypothetical protein